MFFWLSWIWDYVVQMLPCAIIFAAVFFSVRPWRKNRLASQRLVSGPWREGGLLLFVLFCAGLGALTLFQANFWTWGHFSAVFQGDAPLFYPVELRWQLASMELIPLKNILVGGGRIGSWGLFMLLGNIMIFSPLGFFTAALWRKPRWWRSLLTGFCASLFIEMVQFFIGRSSDINDVLLNTLGALCGFWLFLLLYRLMPRFMKKLQCTEWEVPDGRDTGDQTAPP